MANKTATYNIGFNFTGNTSQLKQATNEITNSLKQLQDYANIQIGANGGKIDKELQSAVQNAQKLEKALQQAYNPKLGTYNVSAFNKELKNTDVDLKSIAQGFSKAGINGDSAFRNLTTKILSSNLQLKEQHTLLNNIGTTLKNTIKWGISSAAMNSFTGVFQEAYGYVKNLDSSLNDIRIVTGKSNEEMAQFAQNANKAAKGLSAATTDYTRASLIYYQQGLGDKEVAARTQTTIKAANATGQSTAEVSEQLTAVWNGYKVAAEETESYVDKLSAVAKTTASDLEELSTGMSKVASSASAMGVDVDQLNAQLSTIISVTRQAPESVGNALKTIYARLGDLKVDGADEFGTTLGDVSGQMQQMGINVVDETGNLREMGTVIEEVAAKWQTWTEAQKQAAAIAMAGKRQYNNLIALFENWDMYTKALDTSRNSLGALQKQQDIYSDSIEAYLQRMATAKEGVMDSLFDTNSFKELVSFGTGALEVVENLIDGLGGIGPVLTNLIGLAGNLFNKQLGQGIATTINNLKASMGQRSELAARAEFANSMSSMASQNGYSSAQRTAEMGARFNQLASFLSPEEYKKYQDMMQSLNKIFDEEDLLKQKLQEQEIVLQQQVENYKEINKQALATAKAEEEAARKKNEIAQIAAANAEKELQTQREKLKALEDELRLRQQAIADDLNPNRTNLKGAGARNIRNLIAEDVDNFNNTDDNKEKARALNNAKNKIVDNIVDKKQVTEAVQELTKTKNTLEKALKGEGISLNQARKLYNEAVKAYNNILTKIQNSNLYTQSAKKDFGPSKVAVEATKGNEAAAISSNESAVEAVGQVAELSSTEFSQINQNAKEMADNLEKSANTMESLAGKAEATSNAVDKASQKQQKLADNANNTQAAFEAAKSKAEGLENVVNSTTGLTEEQQKDIDKTVAGIDKIKQSYNGAKDAAEGVVKANAEVFREDAQKRVYSSIVSIVSSFVQLTSVLSSIRNIIKEFNSDEDPAEKASKIIPALLSSLLTLVPAILTIRTQWKTLVADVQVGSAAMSTAISAIPIIGWILAAISAITTLISIVKDLNAQSTANFFKEQQKNIDAARELTEKAEEQKKAVEELTTAYDGLREEYLNQEITLDRLQQRVYELCKKYGLEEEAVKALSASYEELEESIKKAQVKAAKEENEAIENDQKQVEKSAQARFDTYYTGTRTGSYLIGYQNSSGENSEVDLNPEREKLAEKYADILDRRFITLDGDGQQATLGLNMKADGFSEWLLENYTAVQSLMSDFEDAFDKDYTSSNRNGSYSDFYEKVLKYDNIDLGEQLKTGEQQQKTKYSNYATIVKNELPEDLNSLNLADFGKKVEEVLTKNFSNLSLKDIEQVQDAVIDSLGKDNERLINKNFVYKEAKKVFSNITEAQIDTLSDAELAALTDSDYRNAIFNKAQEQNGDIKGAIENSGLSEAFEFRNNYTKGQQIVSASDTMTKVSKTGKESEEKLSDFDIANIFGDNEELKIGEKVYSADEVARMQISEQRTFLYEYFKQLREDSEKGYDEASESLDESIDRLEEDKKKKEKEISNFYSEINKIKDNTEIQKTIDESVQSKDEQEKNKKINEILSDQNKILKLINDAKTKGVNLTQEEEEAYGIIADQLGEEQLEKYKEYVDAANELNTLKTAKQEIESEHQSQKLQEEQLAVNALAESYAGLQRLYVTGVISEETFDANKVKMMDEELKKLKITYEELKGYAEIFGVSEETALSYLNMRNELNGVSGSFEDIKTHLEAANDDEKKFFDDLMKDNQTAALNFVKVKNALKDIFGLDWGAQEIVDNWETIEKAIEGGADGVKSYQTLVAQGLKMQIAADDSELQTQLEKLLGANYEITFDVNGNIDEDFVRKLAYAALLAGKSQEEIQDLVNKIGYSITFPTHHTFENATAQYEFEKTYTKEYQINNATITKKDVAPALIGDGDDNLGGSGGSTGNKDTDARDAEIYYNKEYEKDIYKEINEQLEINKRTQEEIERSLKNENLTLNEQVDLAQKKTEAVQEELNLLNQKKKIAEQEKATATNNLATAGVTVNADGTTNYDKVAEQKFDEIEKKKKQAAESTSKAEHDRLQKEIQQLEHEYDNLTKANNRYVAAAKEINSISDSYANLAQSIDATLQNNDELIKKFTLEGFDKEIKDANKELKALQREMQRLNKQSKKTDNFEERVENLKKQQAQYEKMAEIERRRADFLKALLDLKLKSLNLELSELGIKTLEIGADGQLLNIEEVLLGIDAARNETNKETIDLLIKQIQAIAQMSSEWTASLDKIEDYELSAKDIDIQIEDEKLKEIADRLQKFLNEIKFRLNLAEMKRDWNKIKKEIEAGFKDLNPFQSLQVDKFNLKSYFSDTLPTLGSGLNTIMSNFDTTMAGGMSALFGDDKEKARDTLADMAGQMKDAIGQVVDTVKEAREQFLSAIDKVNDKIEDQIGLYEQLNGILEHNKKLVNLIYGDDAYDKMNIYLEKQKQNNLDQIAFIREQANFWEQQMNSAEVGSEEWEKFKDNWIKAVNDLNSIVEQAIEQIQEAYMNTVNQALKELENKMTGGLGLDEANKAWEREQKLADLYADEVNKAYQLETLQNKINKDLNDMTSVRAQEKLRDVLRDQVDLLVKKDKVSQYELDRAEKVYQVALKQIALEEAQANKTKMRLRRDSQGNYTYQYVADESKTDDARQQLLDAQNDLYNFDLAKSKENIGNYLQIVAQMQKDIDDLAEQGITDREVYAQKEAEIYSYYYDLIAATAAEKELVKANLQQSTFDALETLTLDGIDNIQNMATEEQEILMTEVVPYWDSAIGHMIDGLDGPEGFRETYELSMQKILNAHQKYLDDLDRVSEEAGVDFDKLGDRLDNTITKTETLSEKNETLTEKFKEEYEAARDLWNEIEDLNGFMDELAGYIDEVEAALNRLNTAISNVNTSNLKMPDEEEKKTNEKEIPLDASSISYTVPEENDKNNNNNSTNKKHYKTTVGAPLYDPQKKIQTGAMQKEDVGKIFHIDASKSDETYAYLKELDKLIERRFLTDITGMDTGGYTGTWGPEGKMAMLHEKELVLNKADTKNLLSAVDIVRNLSSSLGSVQNAIQNFATNDTTYNDSNYKQEPTELEQNVHIEANFPNVTNSNEIENAFNNLVNLASQRAMRTRR